MLNEKQMHYKIVIHPLVQDTQPPAACSLATKAVSVGQSVVEIACPTVQMFTFQLLP